MSSTSTNHPRVIIVGAGPTGIGAALRLLQHQVENFVVLEASDRFGGLADSNTDDKGFTWDFGGHVIFSHYQYFDDVIATLGPDLNSITRKAVVFMSNEGTTQPVAYPVQNHVHQMPKAFRWPCVKGLIDAYTMHIKSPEVSKPPNFSEWCLRTMGSGLTDHFMRPYNEKLWAWPLEIMSSNWLGERVAVPDLDKAMYNLVDGREDKPWGPNAQFAYPVKGGTGALWTSIATRGIPSKHVRLGAKVVGIDSHNRMVRLADGTSEAYDVLISTIPLPVLTSYLFHSPLSQLTDRLKHCAVTVVGLGVKGSEPEILNKFHWSYFSDADVPFFRCTALNHYSHHMCPHEEDDSMYYSLLFECTSSSWTNSPSPPTEEDRIAQIEECALKCGLILDRQLIVSRWCNHREYGYPTPTVDRDEILNSVLPTLEQDFRIFSRGRFGAWRYEVGNMDHSMMQGVEAVDRILLEHKCACPTVLNAYFATEPTLNTPSVVNGKKDSTRFIIDEDANTTAPSSPSKHASV